MKGKLTVSGNLQIWREPQWVSQYCPFSTVDRACGQWCPLFGEYGKSVDYEKRTQLHICQDRILYFDEFKDESVKEKTDVH